MQDELTPDERAERVLTMTDEEIEAEIRAEGEDPAEVAEHVRQILRDAVRKHRERPSLLSPAYVTGPLDLKRPQLPRKPKDGGTNL